MYTLTDEQYAELVNIVEDLTEVLRTCELRPHYSGRGMYGAVCLAVVTDNPSEFMFELGSRVGTNPNLGSATERAELIEALARPVTDSMASDTIVYWPSIRTADLDEW